MVLANLFHDFLHEGLHFGCRCLVGIRHFFIIQFHNNINSYGKLSLGPERKMKTHSKDRNVELKELTKIQVILNWIQRKVYGYFVHVLKKGLYSQ
jgi:hypothetical protein